MRSIKNFLSSYLPSPAKTFHEKMAQINSKLDSISNTLQATKGPPCEPEKTPPAPPFLTRNEKILSLCDLNGTGLEISPSYNPVLPKSQGYNIETLDHLDKAGLIAKYTGHNVNVNNIEEPNYIWSGGSYVDAIGKREYYDYIIASHIIEHTVDIIGFLNDCMELLRPNGVLSLVIPDKRKCFDYFRSLSGISEAVNSFYSAGTRHSIGTACDNFLNTITSNGDISWVELKNYENMKFIHPLEQSKDIINKYTHHNDYIDCHHWVFTKPSFELLFYDLVVLGFLKGMDIVKSFDTEGIEFFVTIQKTGQPVDTSNWYEKRMELLRQIA